MLGSAVVLRAEYTCDGVKPGCASMIRAATPAAWGAAAEVPKKLGKPLMKLPPKNVVLTPSGAMMSGLATVSGDPRRLPLASNKNVTGPNDENPSGRRWLKNGTAPTAMALASPG